MVIINKSKDGSTVTLQIVLESEAAALVETYEDGTFAKIERVDVKDVEEGCFTNVGDVA
jgi:hypothetical protein